MTGRIVDRFLALASGPHALAALAGCAFLESCVLPIPPDAVLAPMIIAEPRRWVRYALISTVFSVVGGIAGWMVGVIAFDAIARPLLAFYGYQAEAASVIARFREYGAVIVFLAAITPIPFKVAAIASGAAGLPLPLFTVTSAVARGLRFFAAAALLRLFGPFFLTLLERRLALVCAVSALAAVASFAALRLL